MLYLEQFSTYVRQRFSRYAYLVLHLGFRSLQHNLPSPKFYIPRYYVRRERKENATVYSSLT